MKSRPIIFSGEMVRAILAGRKTQTRRVCKSDEHGEWSKPCPYGKPGDLLWVRETWRPHEEMEGAQVPYLYRADFPEGLNVTWRPSIYMPRRASRITLEVTEVRLERVQDISEEDAEAEGFLNDVRFIYEGMGGPIGYDGRFAVERFEELWDVINAKRGYDFYSNPWVWVIEFRKVGSKPYLREE